MPTEGGPVSSPSAGVLIRLPVGGLLDTVLASGPDFVAVDLVTAPFDEIEFRRVVATANLRGVRIVAIVDETVAATRLVALGADAVTTAGSDELVIVRDAAAPAALTRGPRMVAFDVDAATSASIVAFMASRRLPASPTLVLLPGMLGDARVFEQVVPLLPGGVECRPMRIDVDDSIEEMAASVLAAAPARFALAGHSLGGIVALAICRREPGRITRLALLNTSARAASPAQLEVWRQLKERTDAGEFAAVVAEQAPVNLGSAATDTLVAHWTAMATSVGPGGFHRQLTAQAARPDSTPTLGSVGVPCLVVSGADDEVCPPAVQAELVAGLADVQHVTIPGAGHMSPLDRPAEVAAALGAWLADG